MFIHERGDTHFGAVRVAVVALSALALSIFASPSLAATINVNTMSDEFDTAGNCSLREAIQSANTDSAVGGCEAGSGADIINLPAGTYTLTIPSDADDNLSGALVIETDVELIGAGRDITIIDAAGLDRVIDTRCVSSSSRTKLQGYVTCSDVTIRVSGVTLINGAAAFGRGGGLRVSGNPSGSGATTPVVTLEDSTVSGNMSPTGGGVGNDGVLTIRNTIVRDNTATSFSGGGVDAYGVTTIEDSLIINNSAGTNGGGVQNNAVMTVRRSLIRGNNATNYGGGFFGINDQSILLNNTFVGNSAGISGGGVACGNPSNGCDIAMAFSTLAGNTAPDGENAAATSGGYLPTTFSVKANIFAESAGDDTEGVFVSSGENIVETVGDATGFGASDFLGVDPSLGPLADHGGATQTRLPSATSPALDSATCTDVGGAPVNEDQRNVARPFGAACDVGAVEFTVVSIGGTVSGLSGSGLVLQNNGGDDLSITADGSFTFATALDDGSSYDVTVLTQPGSPSQTCSVSNGSGTLAGADLTNVEVACATDQFTVGGTVTGLEGDQVVLQNNGGDDQVVSADSGFTFTAQDDGTSFNVTVLTQPDNPIQTCTVANGSGTLVGADVTDVLVNCVDEPPEVELSADALDFGLVLEGDTSTGSVTVTNSGTGELVISELLSPDASFAVNGGSCTALPVTLQPGESCDIDIAFTPLTKSGGVVDELTLISNAASSPDKISLRGSTQPLIIPTLDRYGLLLLMLLMVGVAWRVGRSSVV